MSEFMINGDLTVTENANFRNRIYAMTLFMGNTSLTITKNISRKISLTENQVNYSNNLLSYSDGGIKIGIGVRKVLISFNVYNSSSGNKAGCFRYSIKVVRNGTSTIVSSSSSISYNGDSSTCGNPMGVEVQEGDLIELWCNTNTVDTTIKGAINTWVTVQIIETD